MKKVFLKSIRGKYAVSPVISNVILVGAVIAVGFSTLFWLQSIAYNYGVLYSEAVKANIDRLKEKLAFEYVYYNGVNKSLSVYLINCGTVDNVNITTVYLSFVNGTIIHIYPYSSFTLKTFSHTPIANHTLNRGEEGYFTLSPLDLASGSYAIRVTTKRGANFDYTFAV
jgi:hypothetical protein